MRALRAALDELIGLFVDDRAFALAIALWLALALPLGRSGVVPPLARGTLVFAGLAIILVVGVVRDAARISRDRAD